MSGAEFVCCNDTIIGGGGNDHLRGGRGNDVLSGGAGRDRLFGDAGSDILIGGVGRDKLFGGGGDDLLIGGSAANEDDLVSLDSALANWVNRDLAAALFDLGALTDNGDVDRLKGGRGHDHVISGTDD